MPPLLRGLGFLLILLTSLTVGLMEHRANAEARTRMAQAKAQVNAVAEASGDGRGVDSIAREIRLLRLQLQEEDFADRVFENPWFQLLGALGTALVALSFLYEARAKWPRRNRPERSPPPPA
ncbi:hypothetical protein [Frateuria sp. Soil773]|uniref:hypothetical protein n=1 Tax=Frateuria sp. Soil773 TaxID=1736407 RepID=UPI0006F470FF|nr:hypothetical protein [Frateuria sp. Soil773]